LDKNMNEPFEKISIEEVTSAFSFVR
jgi:hypothetical protein